MSAESRTQEEIVQDLMEAQQEKQDLLYAVLVMSQGAFNHGKSDSDEMSDKFYSVIKDREPLLNKIEQLSYYIDENFKYLVDSNSEFLGKKVLQKIQNSQRVCQKVSREVLKLDQKILKILERTFDQTKSELSNLRKGKKALQAYGKNSGAT